MTDARTYDIFGYEPENVPPIMWARLLHETGIEANDMAELAVGLIEGPTIIPAGNAQPLLFMPKSEGWTEALKQWDEAEVRAELEKLKGVDLDCCRDCGVNTVRGENREQYMVHDEIWAEAGMHGLGGMLCIGCLEERLGRQLTPADFTDAPLNSQEDNRTDRLQDRLGMAHYA